MENNITWIAADKIHAHPDNPRKDLGDLTELADSIKKNGIMQNLTVIPDENGEYMALIGHRRCAAAKLVGVKELPCVIREGLSHKDQVAIMLEENMQRNDLTIYEQGQGFQMMLDLGCTQEEIKAKTGFSLSTIRRRINIAKLDRKTVKNNEFQLTISDYAELETIKSIKDRNEILMKAEDRDNLKWRISQYHREKRIEANKEWFVKQFEEVGIKPYTGKQTPQWSTDFETLTQWRMDDEHPSPDEIDTYVTEPNITYSLYAGTIYLCQKKSKDKKKKELTPEEIKFKQREQNRKQMAEIAKAMLEDRRTFIKELIDGKIPGKKDEERENIISELMSVMIQGTVCCGMSDIAAVVEGKSLYVMESAERDALQVAAAKIPVEYKMLCCISESIGKNVPLGWRGEYKLEKGLPMARMYAVLKRYGFSYQNETEEDIVTGKCELYEEVKE